MTHLCHGAIVDQKGELSTRARTMSIVKTGQTTTGGNFSQLFNLFYSTRPISDATCFDLTITYKSLTNFGVTFLVTMFQVPKPLTGKGKKNSLEWIGLLPYEVSGGQRLSGCGSSTVTS